MTTESKRTPLVFDEDYKRQGKINLCQIITSVPKKEQGIVILLDSLEGQS